MTPPFGPYIIVADQALQENANDGKPMMLPYVLVTPPAADPSAIAQITKMLVAAKNPVIVVDRAALADELPDEP